jgi:DNA-binding NarL/FixJ family response regulator
MSPLSREPPPAARLIVVDNHDLARAGLRSLLAGARGLEIVGEARSGHEALALCRRLQPDLVLMDVRLPDMDGLTATRAIRRSHPATRVILFTMYEADDYAHEAVRVGAAGYLLKGATRREVLDAVRSALRPPSAPGAHDPSVTHEP